MKTKKYLIILITIIALLFVAKTLLGLSYIASQNKKFRENAPKCEAQNMDIDEYGNCVAREAVNTTSSDIIVSVPFSNGTSTVLAIFNNTNNTITFNFDDLGTTTLPIAMSGSGARFANSDESLVFWEHQGEATISKEGKEIFKGKKAN